MHARNGFMTLALLVILAVIGLAGVGVWLHTSTPSTPFPPTPDFCDNSLGNGGEVISGPSGPY